MKKCIISQIYYDEDLKALVNPKSKPFENKAKNWYFENEPILNIAKSMILHEVHKWGVLSARYEVKNNTEINFAAIEKSDLDLYVMPKCLVRHDVLGQAQVEHGYLFNMMFKACCIEAGIECNDFNMQVGIYQNGVVAKKHIWVDYALRYLEPMLDWMKEEDPSCRFHHEWLRSDSGYNGGLSCEELKRINGDQIDHYTMHTFVLERLWSLYYHNNKHKITTNF